MKRSFPSSPNTIPDQQRVEERGPGGAIITTAVPSQQHAELYRSTSASSMNSYYSTSSTNTAFGSSFNGHGGGGGGMGGTTASSRQQQSEQSSASLSSLDCFSTIGSSLKRVKISTSPGELRLNKDIEAMAHGRGNGRGHAHDGLVHGHVHGVRQRPQRSAELEWISVDECGGGAAAAAAAAAGSGNNNNNNSPNGGVRYYRTLQSTDGTVIVRRDVVDPLRLRISVTFRTDRPWEMIRWGVMAHSNPRESYETWTHLVQIPRMYPHSPPLVQRITREGGSMPSNISELVQHQRRHQHQQQEQWMRLQQHQKHQQQFLSHQYSSESTAERRSVSDWVTIPPAGNYGGPNGPPMVERIIVSSNPSIHPPSAEEGEMTGICIDSDPTANGGRDPLMGKMATFGGWSPISRLSDLVAFLAELPVKRLEAWTARGGTGGGAGERANNSGSVSSSTSGTASDQNVLREQPHEERRLGENGSRRGVVRRHLSPNQYAYNEDNYATMAHGSGRTVIDRPSHQRRCTSQESDVDVSAIRLASSSTHSSGERDICMEGGQITCSTSASRLPAKLEDPFHPNRFDKGFDRSAAAATNVMSSTSIWRSTSAPEVVASPSVDGTADILKKEVRSQPKNASECIDLDGSRPPMQTTLGSSWGVGTVTSNPPAPLIKKHQSAFDTTSFRQSNIDAHMIDD